MQAVRAARMFDGVSPDLVPDPVVLVDGGRIVDVFNGVEPPGDAELVELGDTTLLPGLIDTHTHLVFNASDDVIGHLDGLSDDDLLDDMRLAARSTLASGVTTIRDLGDRDYLALRIRDETAADPHAGPTVLAAGPPITTTRGHCWFLGGEAADGIDGVRAAVRERAERGVDVVKVMASGGGMTPGSGMHIRQYDRPELRAMVDEAHRLGLPITAHAHATASIADVVAAGFDSIEHCTFVSEDGVDQDDQLIAEIAAAGIAVSATVGRLPGGPPPPSPMRERLVAVLAAYQAMRAAGVTMVAGSDNGIVPVKPHSCFGYGVVDLVTKIGHTPLEALRAVTSVAARVCRVDDRKGRIAPGLDADLVAVAGDPLADIAAMCEVAAVVRAGEVTHRRQLAPTRSR